MGVLPNRLSVDGIEYRVLLVTDTEMYERTKSTDYLAQLNELDNTIAIRASLCASAQEASLIHEVIHAFDIHHSLKLNESAVCTLGVCIPAFLKANGFWHNPHAQEDAHE